MRIEIGDEGEPQGVVGVRVAARVKFGRVWRPVPPITAIRTGSGEKMEMRQRLIIQRIHDGAVQECSFSTHLCTHWEHRPFFGTKSSPSATMSVERTELGEGEGEAVGKLSGATYVGTFWINKEGYFDRAQR